MYELYPYFTNDGTVGLFSRQDNDIYHSTYGALTESWQKFINPSRLKEHLEENNSVKILDICYGIGYNSKTALNVFINEVSKNKKEKKIKNNLKNNCKEKTTIAPIYTDNIPSEINNINNENYSNMSCDNLDYSVAIDTDNSTITRCQEILIDAVDLDKNLIQLSPFINLNPKNNLFIPQMDFSPHQESNPKLCQVKKMRKTWNTKLDNKFRLKKEVSIIILEKLLEQFDTNNDKIIQVILNEKKYSPFLSKYMVNLAKFYQNQGYNKRSELNLLTFLHNIYYKYISKSYKNAMKILKTHKINLNYYPQDARAYIKSTNQTYDYIFLDAFTPTKCPALWTVEFFNLLYAKLNEHGMILTYSNSAAVRNSFLQNGFYVGKSYDPEINKFIGTIATKNESLIEHPLSELDYDLIHSKAGICFKDADLNTNDVCIISNRTSAVKQSNLASSSSILRGYKNDKI